MAQPIDTTAFWLDSILKPAGNSFPQGFFAARLVELLEAGEAVSGVAQDASSGSLSRGLLTSSLTVAIVADS